MYKSVMLEVAIEKILDETLRCYGELYGQSCYFNGKDANRELPKDEFIEIFKNRALKKITILVNNKISELKSTNNDTKTV